MREHVRDAAQKQQIESPTKEKTTGGMGSSGGGTKDQAEKERVASEQEGKRKQRGDNNNNNNKENAAGSTATTAPVQTHTHANLTFTARDIGTTIQIFSFRLNEWTDLTILDFEPAQTLHKCVGVAVGGGGNGVAGGAAEGWLNLKAKPVRALQHQHH